MEYKYIYDYMEYNYDLESLEKRRKNICEKVAYKASLHPKHKNWFVETESTHQYIYEVQN